MPSRFFSNHSAHIEPMEPRRMFADFASLTLGVLRGTGTSDPDRVSIFINDAGALEVDANGAAQTFNAADVRRIVVSLFGGSDRLAIGPRVARAPVRRARGTDTISGGDGRDLLLGGDGRDQPSGGPGNDPLFGDAQADK